MTHWIISSLTFFVNDSVNVETDRSAVDFIQIKQYLIIFVWVRSVAGAIAACEVVIVFISDVFIIFGL